MRRFNLFQLVSFLVFTVFPLLIPHGVVAAPSIDVAQKRSFLGNLKTTLNASPLRLIQQPSLAGGMIESFLVRHAVRINGDTIPSNFWERVAELGAAVKTYATDRLEEAVKMFPDIDTGISQFRAQVDALVRSTTPFTVELQAAAEKNGVSMDTVSEELAKAFTSILDDLKATFPSPDQAAGHEERKARVHDALDRAEIAVIKVGVKFGMDEERIRYLFNEIKPHVEALIVTTGDLIEQHPVLVEVIIFAGVALIIPEGWFLRPLLSLFGFGPAGPVKGSAAAWMQSRFFGAVVPAKSWFSHLQRAGMKVVPPGTGKKVLAGIGAGIGMVVGMSRC